MLEAMARDAPPLDLPNMLTARQICERVGIGSGTLYRWLAEGRFPQPRKFSPRMVRWYASDVEEWAAKREEQPAEPPPKKKRR